MRTLYVLALLAVYSLSGFAQSPDTIRMEDEKLLAYRRAAAPYVAKARATYPAAKKRFLAGLPPGHTFAVMVRLQVIDHAKKEVQQADIFVDVHAIKNGKVFGRINSPMPIAGYKRGELISVSESEIINWLIARSDGSEEGNYVGKFLDHYKPK
ncbi:MAG: hypothetical protein QOF80_2521 [Verrucomicrobiota bacterium]|jgi:hypothetical protein